jgi:hypothetical protein
MMCQAKLTTESKDAASVSKSLNPDNKGVDSLEINTFVSGGKITTNIRVDSITTLMSTVDDLIRCQMTSESLIDG